MICSLSVCLSVFLSVCVPCLGLGWADWLTVDSTLLLKLSTDLLCFALFAQEPYRKTLPLSESDGKSICNGEVFGVI